jgi:cell shape-determining protein MreC
MRFSPPLLLMMALATLGALFLPPTAGESLRAFTGALFLPISSPVRQIAGNVDGRVVKPIASPSREKDGARTNAQLIDEIETLRYQVAFLDDKAKNLDKQLKEFGQIDAKLPVRHVQVIGGDPGTQQVLFLQLANSDGLAHNTPVFYPKGNEMGLAGRLEIIGLGAARVRLVTDKGSAITCGFRRYQKDSGKFDALPQSAKTAEGLGNGRMMIAAMKKTEALPRKEDSHLTVGDWIVVVDKDLGAAAQEKKIGEIESINTGKNPLFVDIIVRPDVDLMKLREVLVPVKKP